MFRYLCQIGEKVYVSRSSQEWLRVCN